MRVSLCTTAMRLLLTCIILIQVAPAEALTEATGYVGDSVTLPSGADPLWELSSIRWSVFTNTTFIATYNNGKINVKRFYRYRGRVHLNDSTGNLTIHNVTRDDATLYTVDLFNTEKINIVNKIKLTVKQRLQKPSIEIVSRISKNDSCSIGLVCGSTDKGVSFSWKVDPHVKTYNTSLDEKSEFFVALLNKKQQVEVTCTSSRNKGEHSSNNATLRCEEDKPEPEPEPSTEAKTLPSNDRNRALSFFLGGFSTAVVLSFTLLCCLKAKSKLLDK